MKEITENKLLKIAIGVVAISFAAAFMVSIANASKDDGGGSGGQVESWQRTGELPTANLPTTLNLETCTVLSETEFSTTWECDSFVFGTFTVVDPKD